MGVLVCSFLLSFCRIITTYNVTDMYTYYKIHTQWFYSSNFAFQHVYIQWKAFFFAHGVYYFVSKLLSTKSGDKLQLFLRQIWRSHTHTFLWTTRVQLNTGRGLMHCLWYYQMLVIWYIVVVWLLIYYKKCTKM